MPETIIEKDEQEFLDWLQAKGLSDQTLAFTGTGCGISLAGTG